MPTNNPKNQHYVPQFILENFTIPNEPQVFVFDKKDERIFRTNIRNVAAENGFYNINTEHGMLTAEQGLSTLETDASRLVRQIIEGRSLQSIKKEERILLSFFIAIQLLRVKNLRVQISEASQALREEMISRGYRPEQLANFRVMGEDDAKFIAMKMLTEANELVPHIFGKSWILFKAQPDDPFYISDNPITLQNDRNIGMYGNIGVAVPGIEIYFPLSATLTLGIYCRSNEQLILETYRRFMILRKSHPRLASSLKADPDRLKSLVQGFKTGNPVSVVTGRIQNLNALQVIYSERFVYSSKDNFDLVREMITRNPNCKSGIRLEVT